MNSQNLMTRSITADAGQEVRLQGFDLSGYNSARVNISTAPFRSSRITIQIDATDSDNVAIDNISYEQVAP